MMTRFIRAYILIAAALLAGVTSGCGPTPTPAAAAVLALTPHSTAELNICLGPAMALLAGRQTCAAEFGLSAHQSVCVPRFLWQKWLDSRLAVASFPACGTFRGRWQAVSFAHNLPTEPPKSTYFRFVIESVVDRVSSAPQWDVWLERTRLRISEALRQRDPLGVVRKLLLGERPSGVDNDLLRDLGFVHLVTASGIHLFALQQLTEVAVGLLGGIVAAQNPRLALGLGRVVSHLLWIIVWLLSGMRVGMLRPWFIVFLRALAKRQGFAWRWWAPLLLALAFDLLLAAINSWGVVTAALGDEPDAWAPGRIHYALAVGGGLLAMQRARAIAPLKSEWRQRLREHFSLAVGAWWFTAVWDLFTLRHLSWSTPILSLLTLPVMSLGVYPLLVFQSIGLALSCGDFWGRGLGATSDILNQAVTWVARAAAAVESVWFVDFRVVFPAVVFASLLIAFPCSRSLRSKRGMWMLGVFLLARSSFPFFSGASRTDDTRAEAVVQLDVGQGDAALVLNPSLGTGWIDTGSGRSLSLARRMEILGFYRVHRIQWVLLTHLDEDHAGGLLSLSQIVDIACVQVPASELHSKVGRRMRAELPQVAWVSEGCAPYPVWLAEGSRSRDEGGKNGAMFGIEVPLRDGRAYLGFGDADSAMEARALPELVESLKNDQVKGLVLKLSHHGSRHSSGDAWLRRLAPMEAWISSGIGNRYGHPGYEVLARAQAAGIPVRRTDQTGALEMRAFR